MTTEQKINGLTWHNAINKIKVILTELFNQKPYKVYTALLTQTEDNDPIAVVLENTLGFDISYTRETFGFYKLTAGVGGSFPVNKTKFSIEHTVNGDTVADSFNLAILMNWLTNNSINFSTIDSANETIDSVLLNTPIEIRVYN